VPFDDLSPATATPEPATLSAFAACDRFVHGTVAEITGGRSPAVTTEAWLSWWSQLALSPGEQMDLWLRACAAATSTGRTEHGALAPPDPRFAGAGWRAWPYSWLSQAHRASEAWWHDAATGVPGVSERHRRVIGASIGQLLQALSPANFLPTNPELGRLTWERWGGNLIDGAKLLAGDLSGAKRDDGNAFAVGRAVAITPGKVVFRDRLIELIQYDPATPMVHPEPILIVPAWIMKYYILDLGPENSLIRFMVEQGHTVFTISWRNPTPEDHDLTMDDYRRLGVMAALDAVSEILPDRKIHAAGYCLGGTMLSIAAAAMARDGDDRLASVTLLAAQTDFTEPGDLKLFIDDTELTWLECLMARSGGLDGSRMAAAFQMLRAEDLIWAPFVHRYLRGETEPPNDLMAWNADQTRMPCRMHAEYLRGLLLDNDLASGRFAVDGRPVALRDIRTPIFALGTAKDHVAPWRSVYKITLLTRSDVTFALVSGGHNAGVVSEPGHKNRDFRMLTMPADDVTVDPESFLVRAGTHRGSWWPAWHHWLAERSGAPEPPPLSAREALCDAPGTYVLAR